MKRLLSFSLTLLAVIAVQFTVGQTAGTGNTLGTTGITAIQSSTATSYKLSIGGAAKIFGSGAVNAVGSATLLIGNTSASGRKYSFLSNDNGHLQIIDSTLALTRFILNGSAGRVGIGAFGSASAPTLPDSTLHVIGGFKLVNGTQGANKILVSDAAGGASWQLESGDITSTSTAGSLVTAIGANKVTYAKMQAASVAGRLLGSASTGTAITELKLGTGLSISNDSLKVTAGGSGTVTSVSTAAANNGVTATWATATTTPALTIGLGAITPSSVSATGTVTGSNLSGTNTGNVTLAGETYLSLAGQAITANAVNLSGTNVTGTLAAARFPAMTGDVTNTAGALATTISNNAVTFAKFQQINTGKLLGRSTAAVGNVEEITIGTGLSLSGGILSASGGGGAVSSVFGRTGAVVAAANDYTFAQIGSKPTTLSGYGITDAATSTHTHALEVLSNVTITTPANGQVLTYNTATSKWVNQAAGASQWTTSVNDIFNSNTGNVGIGVSTPATKLEVRGVTTMGDGTYAATLGATGTYFAINANANADRLLLKATKAGSAIQFAPSNGARGFLMNSTGELLFMGGSGETLGGFGSLNGTGSIAFYYLNAANNQTEGMRLNAAGNLGIANIAPSEKLDVTGNVRFSGALMPGNSAGTAGQVLTSAGPGAAPTWTNAGSGGSGWSLTGNAGTTPGTNFIGTTDVKDLVFKVNNTVAGRITATLSPASNTSFGFGSLASNSGAGNVAIGYGSLANCSGNVNTVIGTDAMNEATTAIANVAIGNQALSGLSTGSLNIAIGKDAGINLVTGSNNIIIGNNVYGADVSNSLNIGNWIYGNNGRIGIGTNNLTDVNFKLFVETGIRTRKVKVDQAVWPDYVFDNEYNLPTLKDVEKFLQKNKHLPDVPSAEDVKNNGIDLGDNQKVLLQKIEELTLYIIEQDKKIEKLQSDKEQLQTMQKQIDELKKMLEKK